MTVLACTSTRSMRVAPASRQRELNPHLPAPTSARAARDFSRRQGFYPIELYRGTKGRPGREYAQLAPACAAMVRSMVVRVRAGRVLPTRGRSASPCSEATFLALPFCGEGNIGNTKKGTRKAINGPRPDHSLRLPPELRAAIDAWAAQEDDRPTRSEATRRILKQALATKPKC